MEFQLPFNDSIRIRLFEPVKVDNSPCHRVVDLVGMSYDHDNFESVDALGVAYASQFHHPDHPIHTEEGREEMKKSAKHVVNTVAVAAPAVAVAVVATPTVAAPVAAVGIATVVVNEITKVK